MASVSTQVHPLTSGGWNELTREVPEGRKGDISEPEKPIFTIIAKGKGGEKSQPKVRPGEHKDTTFGLEFIDVFWVKCFCFLEV